MIAFIAERDLKVGSYFSDEIRHSVLGAKVLDHRQPTGAQERVGHSRAVTRHAYLRGSATTSTTLHERLPYRSSSCAHCTDRPLLGPNSLAFTALSPSSYADCAPTHSAHDLRCASTAGLSAAPMPIVKTACKAVLANATGLNETTPGGSSARLMRRTPFAGDRSSLHSSAQRDPPVNLSRSTIDSSHASQFVACTLRLASRSNSTASASITSQHLGSGSRLASAPNKRSVSSKHFPHSWTWCRIAAAARLGVLAECSTSSRSSSQCSDRSSGNDTLGSPVCAGPSAGAFFRPGWRCGRVAAGEAGVGRPDVSTCRRRGRRRSHAGAQSRRPFTSTI